MPRKIVDLSARSKILYEEPFHVHFWESTPDDFFEYLKDPRRFLERMGIDIPEDCRVETTIENHDWIGTNLGGGVASDNGTIVCNVGGGNIARGVYRVVSYGHTHETVGKFEKRLLHSPEEQEVRTKGEAGY